MLFLVKVILSNLMVRNFELHTHSQITYVLCAAISVSLSFKGKVLFIILSFASHTGDEFVQMKPISNYCDVFIVRCSKA